LDILGAEKDFHAEQKHPFIYQKVERLQTYCTAKRVQP